jgi:hypothetical protein
MIVPYESLVMFIDKRYDPKETKGFVLSSQEKQHALVHGKYNRHHLFGPNSTLT